MDRELYTTLNWHRLCQLIPELGYELIIDCGPGLAMSHFLKATKSEYLPPIISTADFASIGGFCDI